MVVRSSLTADLAPEEVDRIFQALADATRRDILERALQAEHSVSELAASYDMSFAAVQKHVAVLERAGLVTKRRQGRAQLVQGDVDVVHRAARLLDALEALWLARLDRFGDELTAAPPGDPSTSPTPLPHPPDRHQGAPR